MRISDWSSDVCSSDLLLVGLAIAFPGASAFAATPDLDAIRQQVEAQHDEAVKRLQDWIAMPSIAAENHNSREGAQYMAPLARDAGFQKVEIIDTDGDRKSVVRERVCKYVDITV